MQWRRLMSTWTMSFQVEGLIDIPSIHPGWAFPWRSQVGWLPTAFTRWRVYTMLVFIWECSVDLQKHWKCYHHDLSIHMMTKWGHWKVRGMDSLVDVMHGIQKEAPLTSCIQTNAVHCVMPLSVITMKLLNVAYPCLDLWFPSHTKNIQPQRNLRWGFSANLASNSLLTDVQWRLQLEVSSFLTDRSSPCSLQMDT
jgi:hypothetical protein